MESRGIGRAEGAAIGGLERASKLMERGAALVAGVALERQSLAGPAATVDISPRAKALASQSSDPGADIVDGLVDQSIAKHLSAANIKVLQTTEDLLEELAARR